MASFSDLLATFDPDAGKRGKQFEHFVKWFLKNDPEWATQVDKIWLWNDYPGQWGRDCGIDLIFTDKNEKTWAVRRILGKHIPDPYDEWLKFAKNESDKHLISGKRTQTIEESRFRKSAQDDKWSFCLTAGTLCPANQERR